MAAPTDDAPAASHCAAHAPILVLAKYAAANGAADPGGGDGVIEHGAELQPLRLLGIGGGMRPGSLCSAALRTALQLAEGIGARTEVADVRELNLPIFNDAMGVQDYPPTLAWLLYQVRTADAFLLCSPTYHGTVSGAVKNVLDALNYLRDDRPRYLRGKAVGLMALGGLGAANTLDALAHTARALNGIVAPTMVAMPEDAFDANNVLQDRAVRKRTALMIEEVLDLARRLNRSPVGSSR